MAFTGEELPSLELLTMCFEQLKMRGRLHLVGLAFPSRSISEVKQLQASVENGGYHKLLEEEDPCLLMALVLSTLKQAPQPVIPFHLYDYVLEVSNHPESCLGYPNEGVGRSPIESSESDEEEEDGGVVEGNIVKLSKLKKLVRRLPTPNWAILYSVLEFMNHVADLSSVNKLSLDSLVPIFSPLLCRPRHSAYMSLRHLHDLEKIQTVIHSLAVRYDVLNCVTYNSSATGVEEYTAGSSGIYGDSSISSHIPFNSILSSMYDGDGESTNSSSKPSDRSIMYHDMGTVENIIDEAVAMLFDDISEFEFFFTSNFEAMKPSSNGKLSKVESVSQIVCAPLLSMIMLRIVRNNVVLNEGPDSGHCKEAIDDGDDQSNYSDIGRDSNHGRLSFMHSGTLDGPRDRRRMIAACRTLRSQITQYEDAFLQVYDHFPQGHERYPFASTYAQYKQWKREIRYDTATRIQALARGFIARCKYPLKWCELTHGRIELPKAEEKYNTSYYAIELQKLLARKKRVKNQLKECNQVFTANNGRSPTKADKEPMRATYNLYSKLKQSISELELLVRTTQDNKCVDLCNTNDSQIVLWEHSEESQQKRLYEQLKRDKKNLQTLLEKYEEKFRRTYGRGVSSRADIAPVEAEYVRYKVIKQQLTRQSR